MVSYVDVSQDFMDISVDFLSIHVLLKFVPMVGLVCRNMVVATNVGVSLDISEETAILKTSVVTIFLAGMAAHAFRLLMVTVAYAVHVTGDLIVERLMNSV